MAVVLPLMERYARRVLTGRGFASRMLDVGDARIHVYDGPGRGPLPTVVVLHGIGSAGAPFARVLAGLQAHATRVVAPELPGHGFSDPPSGVMTPDRLTETMIRALDALLPEPAIVCGNSLGGALALAYALERPEKVRGLVLLSPAGLKLPESELAELRRTFSFDSTRDTRRFLDRLYHRTPVLLSLLASEVREQMARPVVRHLLETVTPDHGLEPKELARLSVPTLFLWGASERILPDLLLEGFRAHLPATATIEHPEGYGHCPHLDAPADVVRRIAAFGASLNEPAPR